MVHCPLSKLCSPARWHEELSLMHPSAVKMTITNVTFEQIEKTCLFMPYLQFLHSYTDASSPRAVILRVKSRLEILLGFHTRVSEHSPKKWNIPWDCGGSAAPCGERRLDCEQLFHLLWSEGVRDFFGHRNCRTMRPDNWHLKVLPGLYKMVFYLLIVQKSYLFNFFFFWWW